MDSGGVMDLDETLGNYGLGSYQITVCGLMGLVLMYSNISPLSYAITASDLKYRCAIPECDTDNPQYSNEWLKWAVPFNGDTNEPELCKKYRYLPQKANTTHLDNSTCIPKAFDMSYQDKCSQVVFGENERTIVNDFKMMCDDDKIWKLPLVGSINSFGQLIGIPLAGYISDKYGRKFILIVGSVSSAILGTIRSFTFDYYSFVIFEFLDSLASSGVYGATFVLGLELVSPTARITASTLMGCFYPIGAVMMGFVAYMVLDWRIMLRILYLPGLLILGCAWYVPESMRWLQTQNKIEKMAKILTKVAKSNGKTLSPSVEEALRINKSPSYSPEETQLSFTKLMKKIFGSREIFLRLINCSFCWITITFVYYGLSLSSMQLVGNKHLNFMLVNAVEIPAFLSSWFIMDRFSRRNTQAVSLFCSGIGCVLVNKISTKYEWIQLIMFLGSKYAITVAFNNIYVFTAEMFPTELRLSLLGIASMFGRLGSMIAPQTNILGTYFGQNVPVMLFGIISVVAGTLALLFPETKNQKLPDTVKQVESVIEL